VKPALDMPAVGRLRIVHEEFKAKAGCLDLSGFYRMRQFWCIPERPWSVRGKLADVVGLLPAN